MNLVIVDLPIPLEPVEVDLDKSILDQFSPGLVRDAVIQMLTPSSPEQAIDNGGEF